jgi:c-di-AMP phosphodiesterase-like protein
MLNMTSQKRLLEFPIPVIITDNKGEILWYNEKFINETGEQTLSSITSVYEIDKNILSGKTSNVFFADKHFMVFTDCSILNEKEMYILYFFNTTDYHNLLRDFNFAKPVVAHLLIDNYDELFQYSKESEKTNAMVVIDDEIRRWAQSTSGIIRKIERDRYLFIFENRDLSKFIEKRFNILDKIRALTVVARTFPTLSIGIGYECAGFTANEDYARLALDMALSRGGDQVVLKTISGYEFYGGRSNNLEKRTKVKSRVVASSFSELLSNADKVFIMGHQYSDLDSLGASVGVSRFVRSNNKLPYIITDSKNNLADVLMERLLKSEDHKDLFINQKTAMSLLTPQTLLVVVDTHKANLTVMPELLQYSNKIAVIDHHRKAVDFIDNASLFFHEPSASSTCEMVTELLQYTDDGKLTQLEAEALLSGIFLNTKNYTIRTSTNTFEASTYLKNIGANTVNVKLFFQTDMKTYMNKVSLVSNAEIYKKAIAIAAWEDESMGNHKIAGSQAADELLNIEEVHASFTLFRDMNGCVNISARSFGSVNVQLIMEKLEGGGHQTMAGTQLKNITLQDAKKRLISAIDTYLAENNINF